MCSFEGTCMNCRNAIQICASGSVGGARPCQGRGRGFESRLALSLIKKRYPIGYLFFIKSNPGRARSSSVSEDIKPSSVRAKRWSTGPTAPSRALKKTFNRMSFFTLQKSNLLAFFSLLCYINYRHMSITKVRCFHGQTYKMPANLHRTGL